MLQAKLIVVGGDAKAKEIDLNLPTIIGRGREVSLTLPHPLVSRQHTELFEKGGYLYVKDLGSLNGTYVNNRRIDSEHQLKPNELLTLGNVTFRAVYDAIIDRADVANGVPLVNDEHDTNAQEEDDETVSVNRTDEPHAGVPTSGSRRPLKSVSTEPKVVQSVQMKEEASASAKKDLSSEDLTPQDSPTEKAPQPHDRHLEELPSDSDILSSDDQFSGPEKSISVSALESLPPLASANQIADEALEFGESPVRSAIDSIDLDVGPEKSNPEVSDASLGSFLKKLPR